MSKVRLLATSRNSPRSSCTASVLLPFFCHSVGNGDKLPKEKCLEDRAKFPPTSVICQKKEAGVPGGNLVLELIVYQQDHLAYLQLLVSVKSGKWSKINSSLSFQTPEWEGRAGGGKWGGSKQDRAPEVIKKPKTQSLDSP